MGDGGMDERWTKFPSNNERQTTDTKDVRFSVKGGSSLVRMGQTYILILLPYIEFRQEKTVSPLELETRGDDNVLGETIERLVGLFPSLTSKKKNSVPE